MFEDTPALHLFVAGLSIVMIDCANASGAKESAHRGDCAKGTPVNDKCVSTSDETCDGEGCTLIYGEQAPAGDDIQRWEQGLATYLQREVLPPDTLEEGGIELYKERRNSVSEEFNQVSKPFFDMFIEYKESENPKRTFATFRIGQMYFSLGCQIQALEPPSASSGKDAFDFEPIRENVRAIFAKAKPALGNTTGVPLEPWTGKAREILDDMPEEMSELDGEQSEAICREHRRMWASPSAED